jgi:hypothetical protein
VRFVSPISTRPGSALAAALTAGAAVGALTLGPLTAGATGAAQPPNCRTAGLAIWLDTLPIATLRHAVDYNLQMTNLSGHACLMRGYPRISAVDIHGQQIGAAARRDTRKRVESVRLGRGASAKAVLRITDVGIFPRSRCGHMAAAGFRIYLPHAKYPKRVPFAFAACSRRTVRYLAIQAVQPE